MAKETSTPWASWLAGQVAPFVCRALPDDKYRPIERTFVMGSKHTLNALRDLDDDTLNSLPAVLRDVVRVIVGRPHTPTPPLTSSAFEEAVYLASDVIAATVPGGINGVSADQAITLARAVLALVAGAADLAEVRARCPHATMVNPWQCPHCGAVYCRACEPEAGNCAACKEG